LVVLLHPVSERRIEPWSAPTGNSTNDAFTFIGSVANLSLANANGALWFDQGVLYGSTDVDLVPEFSIELVGVTNFELTDFAG